MEKLITLAYGYDALEPVLDKETMEIHHSKHLNTYVTNYNNAIAGTELENKDIIEVITNIATVDESIQNAVRNNGGGVVNHNLFFEQLGLNIDFPEGEFKDLAIKTFGSLDEMYTQLQTAGATRFGSGWSFLVLDKGELKIISTANQDSPLSMGMAPLLALDVWEHSYYLKFNNRRPEYLKEIFNAINWNVVEKRYLENK